MTTLSERLAELSGKATVGPWKQSWGPDDPNIDCGDGKTLIYDEGGHTAIDAALIVELVNAYRAGRLIVKD